MTPDQHYEAARSHARAVLGDSADDLSDASERYARAVEVERALIDEWLSLGRPALAQGGSHGAIVVAHPLLDSMRRAAQAAHRLGEPLGLVKVSRGNLHPNLAPDRKASVRDRKAPTRAGHLTLARKS